MTAGDRWFHWKRGVRCEIGYRVVTDNRPRRVNRILVREGLKRDSSSEMRCAIPWVSLETRCEDVHETYRIEPFSVPRGTVKHEESQTARQKANSKTRNNLVKEEKEEKESSSKGGEQFTK